MPRNNPNGIGPMKGEILGDEEEKTVAIRNSLSNILEIWNSPRIKTEEEAIERTELYIQKCIDRGLRPTIEGWALALGTTRKSLWEWENGKSRGPVSADVVKKAKEAFAAFDADMVSQNKMNPVTYIFRAKNYYGMKDQQEVVITPKQETDPEQLIREAELLPDYDEDE